MVCKMDAVQVKVNVWGLKIGQIDLVQGKIGVVHLRVGKMNPVRAKVAVCRKAMAGPVDTILAKAADCKATGFRSQLANLLSHCSFRNTYHGADKRRLAVIYPAF